MALISLPRRTSRLLLRPFLVSDAEALYACLSDAQTVRFEPYPPFDRAQAQDEAAARADNPDFIAVCLPPDATSPDGLLIGFLFLAPCAFAGAELGYVLNRAYWHRGLAWEACHAAMHAAFVENAEPVHRIAAACDPDNTASWRLMERLGMRREGHFVQHIAHATEEDGILKWHDTVFYAILREEFLRGESCRGADAPREFPASPRLTK